MEVTPLSICVHQQTVGSTHYGSLCNSSKQATSQFQQPVHRTSDVRGRCLGTNGLGSAQQLCQCTISHDATGAGHGSNPKSRSNNHCTPLASPAMVPNSSETSGVPTPNAAAFLPRNAMPEPCKNKHWTIPAWRISGQIT